MSKDNIICIILALITIFTLCMPIDVSRPRPLLAIWFCNALILACILMKVYL